METKLLATFHKIVTTGGFSRAAVELGYAQSTISAQIQALEESLGGAVFERTRKKVFLTSLGKELLNLSEEMLSLEERIYSLSSGSSLPAGELNIAAGESVLVARLGNTLARFREAYPQVTLRMQNSCCPVMIDWVLRGERDVAVLIMPPLNHPDLETLVLHEEEMVFIGPPKKDTNLLMKALRGGKFSECFIHTEQGCSYRVFLEHFLRSRGVIPERTMELWSMEGIKKCVQSGLGISFVPLMYVRDALEEGGLTRLAAPPLQETFVIQGIWRKNGRISRASQKFLALLEEDARSWQ